MELWQLVALGTSLFILYVLLTHRDGRALFNKPRHDIPNHKGIPGLGSFYQLATRQNDLLEWMTEEIKKRATVEQTWTFTSVLFPRQVVINSAQNVEHVLKGNFDNYFKGPEFYRKMQPVFGDGIFNANGAHWKWQRKSASMIFNVKNFKSYMTTIIQKEAIALSNLLGGKLNQGPVDIQNLFFRLTLDTFMEIGFGIKMNCLEEKETHPFAIAFDGAQQRIARRHTSPAWQFEEVLTGRGSELAKETTVIRDFADEVVRKRRADPEADETDLLGRFMKTTNEEGRPLTNDELRDAILNFIIAGRDTTAQAMSWMTYLLALNPEVDAKLFKEIQSVDLTGPEETVYEETSKLVYFKAAFYETLRLYPSVPMNQKFALQDDILPDGTKINAGEYVIWCPYAMGRTLWDDPYAFKPERWIDEKNSLKRFSQGQWPAFHAGPRVCLGQNLATLEATITMVAILQKYKMQLVPGQKVQYQQSLTLPLKYGLKCNIIAR